jgi:hypothetical protein
MIPPATCKNAEENANSAERAAIGAADGAENRGGASDAPGRVAARETASAAVDDAELAEMLSRPRRSGRRSWRSCEPRVACHALV